MSEETVLWKDLKIYQWNNLWDIACNVKQQIYRLNDGQLHPEVPQIPMDFISMDLIGPFEITSKVYK